MASARQIQWVGSDVAVWSAYEPAVKCDLSCTALITSEGMVFIDPIDLAESELATLTSIARPFAILITNGNHSRSAASLRERFGVRIFAPSAARHALDIDADVLFNPDVSPLAGIDTISIPSAGPGEVAYRHGDTLVIGDALIHLEATGFALLPEKYCADAAKLPGELRKLLTSLFKTMTFAHGAPLTDNPRQLLKNLLA